MTIPKVPNFLAELDAAHAETLALLSMSNEQLNRHPAPGKWSALQCIDHVILSNRAYIDLIRTRTREAIAQGRTAKHPFRYSLLERVVIWAVEPPSRLRIPLPSPTVAPSAQLDVTTVREEYEQMYADFRRCIQDALAARLRGVRIPSPFAARVSGNAGIVLGVLLAHERRHLYQARKAALGPAA